MKVLVPVCLALLFFSLSAIAAPGEWPVYRGNSRQDGHASVPASIAEPRIVWKKFFGLVENQYVLQPPGDGVASWKSPWGPTWGMTPAAADIGGQATPLQNSKTTTFAEVLAEYPGLEKLEFESGFDKPQIGGQWQDCYGRCFAWKEGQWVEIWKSEAISMLFQPLPVAGDFDQDGHLDVAILPWNELVILDAATGKISSRCTFTEGRSYGALYVDDLDGDGRSEFVVMADFAKHIDVLGYREGKLALLWRREIELSLANSSKMLRVHPRAVADVTGDGRKEVLGTVFNESGDGRWHVLALDGLTGAVVADYPDEMLQGVADGNGDGVEDCFTAQTHDANQPPYSRVRVRTLAMPEGRVLWEGEESAWELWQPPVPPTVNTAATKGREDVVMRRGENALFVALRQPADNGHRLSVMAFNKDGATLLSSAVGPLARTIALDTHGNLHFRSAGPDEARAAAHAAPGTLASAGSSNLGMTGQTAPIVVREGEAAPRIVVPGPDEQMVVLETRGENEPVELGRIPGRAQAFDWPTSYGVSAARLAAADTRQVISASAAPEGHARLVATDLDGTERWHHDFPSIPGTAPVWNTGGILFWQPGRFTNPDTDDILVQVRRSIMHTEETHLLSGKDGSEIWSRAEEVSGRGVGGTPFAIADFNGDGLDDAASFHPSIMYILQGTTGADLIAMDATWDPVPLKPVYWGLPTAGDFENTGKNSLFFYSGQGAMNLVVRPDGALAWWAALDQASNGYPAFGHFDGTGHMQAITFGAGAGLRCQDTATGEVQWHLPLPPGGFSIGSASADLDGDGRDEALFVLGNNLYCLETAETGEGRIAWQFLMPATTGPPAIADVEGSGRASILLAGVDGYLYCLR